jgi:hypothetical protein
MLTRATGGGFADDLPDLAPIVATEATADGWRGVTADGEIYLVRADEGAKMPESIVVSQAGKLIGRRRVVVDNVVSVTDYLEAFDTARTLHRAGRDVEALVAIDRAIAIVDTARARHNRAMILLAAGRWREGLVEYELCERAPPFERSGARRAIGCGIAPWCGEPIAGRRLLIVHDHGFGDAVMALRFVAAVRARGAAVVLAVAPELARIARQFGDVDSIEASGADCFTSFLHLLRWLEVEPATVPIGPYVDVDAARVALWRKELGAGDRRRIGVAWSTGVGERDGDFPRALPLADLLARVKVAGAEVHSLQTQGRDEARDLGVLTHDLYDFAATAALMSVMDEVVCVDTAAVHVAGAIGHSRATVLLSRWRSWRWRGNPFYPAVKIADSGR